jgi:hypothetical protein
MKMKLFATLAVFAVAVGAQAANVSINNISVLQGTPTVAVPLLIAPSAAGETIGAMNISFAAGSAGDAIPILNTGTVFDGSIWTAPGRTSFGAAGTPATHSVLSAVAMISPLQIPAGPGTIATYTLDTSGLAPGTYDLDPDFQIGGVGSSGDPNVGGVPSSLTFANGTLTVSAVIPEPSTIAMTAVFSLLGLGVILKRRGR